MDGLRPVGSEAIKDPDKKLARILEMAGIKKDTKTTKINESSIKARKNDETILHTATASNGQVYGIVQEGKHVYIKEAKNGYFDYIGGVQNIREHSHKSYAEALKHLNFMFKEINTLTETKVGTNILGEGYKLKVGTKEPVAAPAAEDNFDFGGGQDKTEEAPADDNFDFGGGEDNADAEPDFGGEEPAPNNGNEEETSVKKIQKLAGKLAQEIRDAQEGEIDDKLAKSVTNTILSATLSLLSDEGKEEIANKLEDGEEGVEADGQDFADFDMGGDDNAEEAPAEEPAEDDVDNLKLEAMDDMDDVEEHNEPFDPSPMSKPGGHEVTLEEDGLPEHDEPFDPSPMSRPGDHEVHEAMDETDPYSLYEAALNAIMEKAAAMQDLKGLKSYMGETWAKMESAYNDSKYRTLGKLAEAMADMEEHNEPLDPSPMSRPGDHEVHESMRTIGAGVKGGITSKKLNKAGKEHLLETEVEEHNEPNDPSPMSKPGDHEVHESMRTAGTGVKGGIGSKKVGGAAKQGLVEGEVCGECGKAVCECDMEEHNEPLDPSPMSKPGDHEVKEDINEALNFLKNKINNIKNRLND